MENQNGTNGNQNATTSNHQNPQVTRSLTFGEKAVGLTFNPSGDNKETKAKQLFAEAIDLLEEEHHNKVNDANVQLTWTRNVLRTAAFNAIITAQMAVVKYLTWRD